MIMFAVFVTIVLIGFFVYNNKNNNNNNSSRIIEPQKSTVVYITPQQEVPPPPQPMRRYNQGIQQVGILSAEGGSSSSAAPDRTILPLFGRELDVRRSRWNYYTRTDGTNPVQVPVRVGNRLCDDDRNGCNEVFSDDSVHVPALSRSFKATIYKIY